MNIEEQSLESCNVKTKNNVDDNSSNNSEEIIPRITELMDGDLGKQNSTEAADTPSLVCLTDNTRGVEEDNSRTKQTLEIDEVNGNKNNSAPDTPAFVSSEFSNVSNDDQYRVDMVVKDTEHTVPMFDIGDGDDGGDMDIGVDLSLDESGVLESEPTEQGPSLAEETGSADCAHADSTAPCDTTEQAASASELFQESESLVSAPEQATSPVLEEGEDGHKPGSKRVTFPSDDDIVSGAVEPKDPWRHAQNATVEEILSAYRQACQKLNCKPIPKVLKQIQELKDLTLRNECLDLKGEKLDYKACESLEELLKRVQFKVVDLEQTNLDEDGASALFDMIEYYESATHLNISFNKHIGTRGWQAAAHMMRKTSSLQYLDARNTPLLDHSAPFVARALRISGSLAVLHLENAGLSGRPLMLLGNTHTHTMYWTYTLTHLYIHTQSIHTHALALPGFGNGAHTLRVISCTGWIYSGLSMYYCCPLAGGMRKYKLKLIYKYRCIQKSNITDPFSLSPSVVFSLLFCHLFFLFILHFDLCLISHHLFPPPTPPLFPPAPSVSPLHPLSLPQPCTQSLETLNLGHNSVGNEGIHKLKDGLISNRSVLRLGLASTKLSCEGAVAVAEFIAESPRLLRLDLRENEIKTGGLMALSLALKVNTSLLRLDLDREPKKETVKSFIETQRALLAEVQNGCKRNFILAKEKEETEQQMRQSASMAEIATEDGTGVEEEEGGGGGGGEGSGDPGERGRKDSNGEEEGKDTEEVAVRDSQSAASSEGGALPLESDSDTEEEEEEVVLSKPAARTASPHLAASSPLPGPPQTPLSASRTSPCQSPSPTAMSGITITESSAPPGTPPSPGRCISVSSPGRGHKIFMVTRVESPPDQNQVLQHLQSKAGLPAAPPSKQPTMSQGKQTSTELGAQTSRTQQLVQTFSHPLAQDHDQPQPHTVTQASSQPIQAEGQSPADQTQTSPTPQTTEADLLLDAKQPDSQSGFDAPHPTPDPPQPDEGVVGSMDGVESSTKGTVEAVSVEGEVVSVEGEVVSVEGEVVSVKGEVVSVEGEVVSVKGEVVSVKGEVVSVEGEVVSVKGEVVSVEGEVVSVEGEVVSLEGEVVMVEGEVVSVEGEVVSVEGEVVSVEGEVDGTQAVEEPSTPAGLLSGEAGGLAGHMSLAAAELSQPPEPALPERSADSPAPDPVTEEEEKEEKEGTDCQPDLSANQQQTTEGVEDGGMVEDAGMVEDKEESPQIQDTESCIWEENQEHDEGISHPQVSKTETNAIQQETLASLLTDPLTNLDTELEQLSLPAEALQLSQAPLQQQAQSLPHVDLQDVPARLLSQQQCARERTEEEDSQQSQEEEPAPKLARVEQEQEEEENHQPPPMEACQQQALPVPEEDPQKSAQLEDSLQGLVSADPSSPQTESGAPPSTLEASLDEEEGEGPGGAGVGGSALPNGLKPEFSLHLLDPDAPKPSPYIMEHTSVTAELSCEQNLEELLLEASLESGRDAP
ncbi:protein phosphatase 1 regulatory subunit 37 [Osmerus eperlanus]|uniref:protein phosphatase 1 regulatory subunit 37 n=1 Tax=Osmerus eperlanus TaxID=29151 RepID=UPI002E131BD3